MAIVFSIAASGIAGSCDGDCRHVRFADGTLRRRRKSWPWEASRGENPDGQLDVFRVDANGELRHRWRKQSDGDWSSWSSLDGSYLPDIAVANDATGRIVVFAVDRASREIKCLRQQETNSLEWSTPLDLGGPVQAPVTMGQDLDDGWKFSS